MILGLHRYIEGAKPLKGSSGGSGGGGSEGANSTVQSRPELSETTREDFGRTTREYTFTAKSTDGEDVIVDFTVVGRGSKNDPASVNFSVGGDFNVSGLLDQQTSTAVASRVSSIMRQDAASRRDGFVYSTTASLGDGRGTSRAALYARAGFSLPRSAGERQIAIVRNGRLTPGIQDGSRIRPLNTAEQRANRESIRAALRAARSDRRAN